MSASDINNNIFKDGVSPKTNDDVCEVNDMLQNMSTADNGDVSACASCGKEGSDNDMNTCNKCNQVKYCNAACKKKHRSKHKKDCRRRAAELHDEKLFKHPPQLHGDCPICFLRIPTLRTGRRYQSCCGKFICSGCIHAPVYDNQGNKVAKTCPFCRTQAPYTEDESNERLKKRMEANDAVAIFNTGCYYYCGTNKMNGYRVDHAKAFEFWHRSAELGYSEGYCNIGIAYDNGYGVEAEKEKAVYHYELAAVRGDVNARHILGFEEESKGNFDRAIKHYMIAVSDGDSNSLSLKGMKRLYSAGYATKDVYTRALQAYQAYLSEIKSDQRDKAAAARENLNYY